MQPFCFLTCFPSGTESYPSKTETAGTEIQSNSISQIQHEDVVTPSDISTDRKVDVQLVTGFTNGVNYSEDERLDHEVGDRQLKSKVDTSVVVLSTYSPRAKSPVARAARASSERRSKQAKHIESLPPHTGQRRLSEDTETIKVLEAKIQENKD